MGIRGLLLDLDGVFYVSNHLLPGAIETLDFLRSRHIPFRIVTNTTTLSRASLVDKVRRIGLPLEISDVINAPFAAALYLHSLGSPRCRFVVAEDTRSEFAEFTSVDSDPDYIVLGDIEDQVSYNLLNTIFNQMVDGASLVALHKGKFWQTAEGLKVDLGLFVAGLEYTTGKIATVIGKPSPTIFALALKELGIPTNECAMIGDDLYNDVGGAQLAGLKGILIRTGKYRSGPDAETRVIPDGVIDSLRDLPRLLT
jgi:HAD superfamily hydrolase (TIGR01458 family)